MATRRAIGLSINSLKMAYPNYNPDVEGTATLWEKLLSDVEDSTLEAAVLVCLTERRAFAPSVGEIRAAAIDLHVQAAGIPSALEAYAEVVKMPASMQRRWVTEENGQNIINSESIFFSHPIIETVARNMGWPDTFPTDNPGVDRGQFRQAYDYALSQMSADGARLPIIQQYIESKRPLLTGDVPALVAGVTKRLEKS